MILSALAQLIHLLQKRLSLFNLVFHCTAQQHRIPHGTSKYKPRSRKGYARQRRHSKQEGGCSKMAVSRHLGYYRTGNSAIRSADPENPCLEPNMEWIGCTVCEIFAFKLYCDLETGVRVTQGHRKRHHSIEHIDFIFVFHSNYASISYRRFRDIAAYLSKIATPCICRPRWE